MSSGQSLLGIIWGAGFILIVLLVMARRKTRRSGTMTGAIGAVWDLQTDQKRKAYEIILEERAEARDPEDAEGHHDPFSQLEFTGWQRVAGRYQDTWAELTSQFVPALLEAIDVKAGERVLDVCCGPGTVAENVEQRRAIPVGLDFSPDMLQIARGRCAGVEFRQGDAQALPFDEGAFDAVVMNFGLLHLPRPEQAFAEAARVLRPGGRYTFTAWAGGERSPGAKIVQDALEAHANLNVDVPKGPDHLRHGRLDEWTATLAAAGFDPSSVTVAPVRAEWDVPTDFFLFEAERHAGVRTAALLAAQTRDALAQIERQMTQAVRAFPAEHGYAIPYVAYVISATKRP